MIRPFSAMVLIVLVLAPFSSPCTGNAAEPPPVRIAYFVSSDRQPLANYQERLDRVMTEVQRFYRDGMAAAGYRDMTFRLDRAERARLRIYLVRGKHPMRTYGRDSSDAVRNEVKAALAAQGLDIEREVVVVFQTLLEWKDGQATEIGPYCGAGNHLAGTAWVYDDERLDARLLSSKAPGGYYGGPCSIGEMNSHYIGGVAHELGHGFGLPHDSQRAADGGRGISLMGGGNHTYGRELRKEGTGTFLTAASALPLASVRAFAGDKKDAGRRPGCTLRTLEAAFKDGTIVLSGTVDAAPPAYAIVGYNDPAEPDGDYDALGWTCKVDPSGRFRLTIGELQPGKCQLRLRVCHASGAESVLPFDYAVDRQGKPDLKVFRLQP